MQSEELIKKIIIKSLFNLQEDKLSVNWQEKINKTSSQLYLRVLQPLKMINSVLMDSQANLKKENINLQTQNNRLLHQIQQLKWQQNNQSTEEKGYDSKS